MKKILLLIILTLLSHVGYSSPRIPNDNQATKSDTSGNICWALKSNMLYDAAFTPNIGLEINFNKRWSTSANWMYAWWSNESKHRFWRIYGGEIEARYWLGGTSQPVFKGHHLGIYAQVLTYDFEFGKRGYMADKWSYGAGLSYGYSHVLNKRFRLDCCIGIGYLGGKYKEYTPIDNCYVWQSTKQRRWFGPTKAEISLVWLLNPQKGGRP